MEPLTLPIHSIKEKLKFLETDGPLLIGFPSGEDDQIIFALTNLVNDTYRIGEFGMWKHQAPRTSIVESRQFVNQGLIAVAFLVEGSHAILVGTVKISKFDETSMAFGQLAVDRRYAKKGIGKKLIQYAEKYAKRNLFQSMVLEILFPEADYGIPLNELESVNMFDEVTAAAKKKALLNQIYSHMGYEIFKTGGREFFEAHYPGLADLLACECRYVVYRKNLMPGAPSNFH